MKKTGLKHEVIYIKALGVSSSEGDAIMLLALDDYSKFLFPTVTISPKTTDNGIIGLLVDFLNGINKTYDRKIHAQGTNYYTDTPQSINQLLSGALMEGDKLIYDAEKVNFEFKHIIEKFK